MSGRKILRPGGSSARGFLAALLLLAALPPRPAEAVIPSAFGPLQALLVILPQLLVALGAALLAMFKPRTYKILFLYLWTHKGFTLGLVAAVFLAFWLPRTLFGSRASAETGGASWAAFRGGPERTGALAGSKGVATSPVIAWKLAGEALGSSAVVDSSPAIVGNRIYAGVGLISPFGSSGSLVAVDADTGALAWSFTGRGEMTPPLRPVFSSPAVLSEGTPPAARFLVSGEGYHEDRNCRILCLDLEPLRKGSSPRLHWLAQTTSHVERASCLHEGRVFIGAGDDGFWGVDLATGRVLWHLEGAPYYEVQGPRTEELGRLEGRTVVAVGVARRVVGEGRDDVGTLTLEVRSFREGTEIPPFDGRTFERPVRGRVERREGKVRIVPEAFFPDCESPPVAVGKGDEARLLFGCGVGGNAVVCVRASTGALLWRTATPYPAFGALTVAGDRVILGVGNGNYVMSDPNPAGAVVALSLDDGRELWRVETPDTIIGAVAVREGRAYACCRDGHIYSVNVLDGGQWTKLPVGSPMVCSPAVTETSIYATTTEGKIFCLDRKAGNVRWSMALTPGKEIFSSPTVAGSRLYVGTRNRGLVALEERTEERLSRAPRPWLGPGGDPGRTGCADDRGLPPIEGDTADLKWPDSDLGKLEVESILAAQGPHLFVATRFGKERAVVGVEIASGKRISIDRFRREDRGHAGLSWIDPDGSSRNLFCRPGEEPVQAFFRQFVGHRVHGVGSISAYNLVFAADALWSRLTCSSDLDDQRLWSVEIGSSVHQGLSVSGDRLFLSCAGKGENKGFLEARRVVDGSLLWRQPLEEPPSSYPVAAGPWVAVASGDQVAVFRASDGKARDPVPVGGKAVAPALCGDVLVIAGEERIAAYDLSASEWLWNYRDQDHIGTAVGQPVVAGGVIWVGTTRRGLVAIGVPERRGP